MNYIIFQATRADEKPSYRIRIIGRIYFPFLDIAFLHVRGIIAFMREIIVRNQVSW